MTPTQSPLSDRSEVGVPAAAFIQNGVYQLATISVNDYGYQQSSRMALHYLQAALLTLESKRAIDQLMSMEIALLQVLAQTLAEEYRRLDQFCTDCTLLRVKKTVGVVEWAAKCAVRMIGAGYLSTTGHHLAHKLRTFHSRTAALLLE
jgi:hypothetical protein